VEEEKRERMRKRRWARGEKAKRRRVPTLSFLTWSLTVASLVGLSIAREEVSTRADVLKTKEKRREN